MSCYSSLHIFSALGAFLVLFLVALVDSILVRRENDMLKQLMAEQDPFTAVYKVNEKAKTVGNGGIASVVADDLDSLGLISKTKIFRRGK